MRVNEPPGECFEISLFTMVVVISLQGQEYPNIYDPVKVADSARPWSEAASPQPADECQESDAKHEHGRRCHSEGLRPETEPELFEQWRLVRLRQEHAHL